MPEPITSFFSPKQQKIIGIAASLASFLLITGLLVFIASILSKAVGTFSGLLWPLAVAGITALMLRPVVGVIERNLHTSRIFSVIILFSVFSISVLAFILSFLPSLITQLIGLIDEMPSIWNRAITAFRETYPDWVEAYNRQIENETIRNLINGIRDNLKELVSSLSPNLKAAGNQVLGIFGVATGLAIIPVYLFFFLLSDEDPTKRLPENLPFLKDSTRDDLVFLIQEFISIIVSFFRGQLLIGLIMGALLSIGFWIIGLKFAIILGMSIGLLNVVPYLGTILGLVFTMPTAYLQPEGGFSLLGFSLLVFVIVQIIESYLLTPKIMGKQTGLHPVTIIIAIFFWGTALGGILGMVLAIPLTAFFVTVWRLGKRKYFAAIV
ncbi:MAG: AI-2E family transporter [Opitutaceae bacterium]|nr:AI-2E family transporter [Opitutaceae bacterium]